MKFLKFCATSMLGMLIIGVIFFNISLYYSPRYLTVGESRVHQGLMQQLAQLKSALHNGAADDMQAIYPEGFVFLNALYGLNWIELAEACNEGDSLYQEASAEMDWVLAELASEKAKQPFNPSLEPAYGIFYRGWSNYVLGRKLSMLPKAERSPAEVQQFQQNCREITQALDKQSSPFLESYALGCWPADMTVAMASVAIHEKLFPGTYAQTLAQWIEQVELSTDHLGLIPHAVDSESGKVLEPARGSSQSLILNFLMEIDSTYALEKFEIYQQEFLAYRLGLPGIREYPENHDGAGDIDSGPVIWGMGGAASIVGQRVMAKYGAPEIAVGIRNSVETFGLGHTHAGKKHYLFGALPMADAFIAWSNSAEASEGEALEARGNWRLPFQLISLLAAMLCAGLGFLIFRRKGRGNLA
ncbi:hypothetical protein [Pontibacter sp. G13]|uniref:hypothetical protein n=1 Tax=Pontibacter sp. G13 TaxID=3074898 RepID=UPI00288B9E05|nr:hypothetical protein [Pontibacter sp. G13]WNJ19101.1 hypothetical protein RJD25_01305 [Pontibacter sp. G13]